MEQVTWNASVFLQTFCLSISTSGLVLTFVNTLGCLYLLMNLSLLTLFIAENFDVVRYSVFKEQIYIRYITDIKSYQAFPDRILYPYIERFL